MYIEKQPPFLNAVAELRTSLQPRDLLQALKLSEQKLGRGSTSQRYGPRLIDLDLLIHGDHVQKDERGPHPLEIPHPRIAEREFVLRPLSDIDPQLKVPTLGAASEMLRALCGANTSEMHRVTPVLKGDLFACASRTLLMGIINATPDSFSDGGQCVLVDNALERAAMFVDSGFDIVDIGGQSTRPGAPDVSEAIEQERVLPVIDAIHTRFPQLTLSIDTFRATTASAAVDAGAHIVNDVSAGNWCPEMRRKLACLQKPWVAMHTRGRPSDMARQAVYRDVVSESAEELATSISAGLREGIARWNVVADGGIGFAKNASQNKSLLRGWPRFRSSAGGFPTLLGLSRKSFLAVVAHDGDRDWPTAGALCATVASGGVDIARVHDPRVAAAVRAADFIAR